MTALVNHRVRRDTHLDDGTPVYDPCADANRCLQTLKEAAS